MSLLFESSFNLFLSILGLNQVDESTCIVINFILILVFLNMNKGVLSFAIDGQYYGIAF